MNWITVTSGPITIYPCTAAPLPTRAKMVARMRQYRADAIAKGMRLLSWEEIEQYRNDYPPPR